MKPLMKIKKRTQNKDYNISKKGCLVFQAAFFYGFVLL